METDSLGAVHPSWKNLGQMGQLRTLLTGIRLYCTVSTSLFFVPLVCRFLAIQYKMIQNINGGYSTYNFQSRIMLYGPLRIHKLPVC